MPFDGNQFLSKPPLWNCLTQCFIKPPIPPNNVDAIKILKLSRSLIKNKKHWIQHIYNDGRNRYCAIGALHSSASLLGLRENNGFDIAYSSLHNIAFSRGFPRIEAMNDKTNHKTVMTAFDEAIIDLRQLKR